MKSRMAPSFLSTIKTMSRRVLCKHAVVKSALRNTVHAEELVAVFIAHVKTTSQVNSV